MSNLATNLSEKLPKFVRTRVEAVEAKGRKLVERVDHYVEQALPEAVTAPLRGDKLTLDALRQAAKAAGQELEAWVKGKKDAEPEAKAAEPKAAKPAPKKRAAPKRPAASKASAKPAAKPTADAAAKPARKRAPRKATPASTDAPV